MLFGLGESHERAYAKSHNPNTNRGAYAAVDILPITDLRNGRRGNCHVVTVITPVRKNINGNLRAMRLLRRMLPSTEGQLAERPFFMRPTKPWGLARFFRSNRTTMADVEFRFQVVRQIEPWLENG